MPVPIVSVQDGPRIMGKMSNFGGKKAAPYGKGGKRVLAKALVKKAKRAKIKANADLANTIDAADVTKIKSRAALPDSAFVFPEGKRYPIPDEDHARLALQDAKGKPEYPIVLAAVRRKFPNLTK